ncbi:hypothetical protein BGW42_008417 [Actinomortierella wolfii]|nr:hypothetical protein BGW42_008417 [Actinomortierella wolfii]
MQPDQHPLPLQSHPLSQQHPPLPSMLNPLQQHHQQAPQAQQQLPQQIHQQQQHHHQHQHPQSIRTPLGGATLNAATTYTSLPLHHAQPTLVQSLDRAGGMAAVNSSQAPVLAQQHQQPQPHSSQQALPPVAAQQHPQQQKYEDDANRYYMAGNTTTLHPQQQQHQQQQQQQAMVFPSPGSNKRKASFQHPGRPNPTMYPSPASSTTTPVLQSASLGAPMPLANLMQSSGSSVATASSAMAPTVVSSVPSADLYATSSAHTQAPVAQMSQMQLPPSAHLPNAPGNSIMSTSYIPGNTKSADAEYVGASQTNGTDLYSRQQQDAPLFASIDMRGWSAYPNLGASQVSGVSESSSSATGGYRNNRLPSFDVKAYTFRKKPRHYVAVKPKNALRIEPIIYLRTSILDAQRIPVKNWDFLRFATNRFRDNALPKKKLNNEEMKGARILDVDIVLVSPNNNFRQIEESCPACVMRMDGERKIMQVLAKNFKMTPAGEPVIDIRKGHAIVCIKLNCYCDHHNESEGFVVRLQTHPETVRMGGSVKLRICCEARSKNGTQEQEQEEEDGLTDIDAPGSIGSRSPAPTNDHLQSPSLSYGSPSPMVKGHGRTPSSTASSIASPRSFDERSVTGLDHISDPSGQPLPKFRNIYPLTPSEGTCLGGTRVTIHGSGFSYLTEPAVFFGDQRAELVMVSHDDVMECTTPPAQGLKPGLVQVKIASQLFPAGQDTETADFLYMAPLDYDFCNLAAASLSFAMSGEYYENNVNNLAALFGTQGADTLGLSFDGGSNSFISGGGLTWAAMETMALDFLAVIKQLAPGRPLRAHRTEEGHTWLHLAVYGGMTSLAEELIKMGIDYTATDANKRTALELARTMTPPSPSIISTLENAEALHAASTGDVEGSEQAQDISAESARGHDISLDALIKKYEPYLRDVCQQEQQRKARAEEMRATRSRELMAFRVRQQLLQQRQAREDAAREEEDDVMTEEEVNDDGDGSEPMEGISIEGDSKSPSPLLTLETKTSRSSSPVSRNKSPVSPRSPSRRMSPLAPSSDVICASHMTYIKSDIRNWESTRRHGIEESKINHIVGALNISPAIQTWVCQDLVSKDESDSPSKTPRPSCVIALSATGVHVYPRTAERPSGSSSTNQSTQVPVRNWSILEIEDLTISLLPQQNEGEQQPVSEVTIHFGHLWNSSESIRFSTKNAAELANTIAKRHQAVMQYLQLRPRIEPKMTVSSSPLYQPSGPIEKDVEWLKTTLKIWCGIYNVERSSWDNIEWEKNETFKLLPLDDDTPTPSNSINFMVALMRTLSDFDPCLVVDLSNNQLESDGWAHEVVLHELESMVHKMRQVVTWKVSGCQWRSVTAKVFLNALTTSPAVELSSSNVQSYKVGPASSAAVPEQMCDSLYLANNPLGDDVQVNMGQFLVDVSTKLPDLDTLDLTNCSLELEAVEYLVHHLTGFQSISLTQNKADERWWQWMNVLLERNPLLTKASIGAPIAPADQSQSLISIKRLQSLRNLEVLDLSNSSQINSATIKAIEQLVEYKAKQLEEKMKAQASQGGENPPLDRNVSDGRLRTISLAHCNLAWKQVASLFKTICETNTWSKFTLCLDRNPLFDDAESMSLWKDTTEALVQEPFGVQMADLVLPNATVRELLEPLEYATCFNGVSLSGLCIVRENERAQLEGLPYDERWQRCQQPTDASQETCEMLKRVVEHNKTLIELDLSGGQMPLAPHKRRGGFGWRITTMFPALSNNPILRVLTINRNGFGEDGLAQLAKALQTNRRLNVLETVGNDAHTYKGLSAMEKILPPPAFQGGLVEAQNAGYNSTLALWKPPMDEVMMHLQLMGREILRLQTELVGAEKAHEEAKRSTHKTGTEAALRECRERVNKAIEDRTKYERTLYNVTQSILGNVRRIDAQESSSTTMV